MAGETSLVYEFRGYTQDPRERILRRGGERVALRRRAFDVLCVLVANGGALVEAATFFGTVWRGVTVSEQVLRVTMRELRVTLGDDVRRPDFIETVLGAGYRFVAPVTARRDPRTHDLTEIEPRARAPSRRRPDDRGHDTIGPPPRARAARPRVRAARRVRR